MGNRIPVFYCFGRPTSLAVTFEEELSSMIYDVWDTNRTKAFAERLRKYLVRKGYRTLITNNLKEELLNELNCPIIALCLLHSRHLADIKYTLTNLEGEHSKGVILVLLHYRSNDTRTRLYDDQLKRDYPEMSVHNCFLQDEFENIKEVNKDICNDIQNREILQKRKALQQKS